MRPEKLYLVDILEASDAVLRFIEPIQEEEFLKDELRQSGVLQKLIVIGVTLSYGAPSIKKLNLHPNVVGSTSP